MSCRLPAFKVSATLLVLITLVFGCAESASNTPASVDKPNIILILSDDQGWQDYGFMQHAKIQTPNLDALAQQGVSFKQAYVPTALCRPSLLTIASGHYAHSHGVTGNDPSSKDAVVGSAEYNDLREQLIAKTDDVETLPELLAEQGYVSFQSGKWWEGNFSRGGFDDGMTEGFPQNKNGRHGDKGLSIGRKGNAPVKDFIDKAHRRNKPYFLWYAPYLPHEPHNPPKRLLDKYLDSDTPERVAKYYAMVDWFDESVGDLLSHVDKSGDAKNTLIVYVTDNGWIQNPVAGGKGFLPGSKQSANEAGVRTPIIFKWPAQLSAQQRTELISSIDIVPTLLAAAGAKIPNQLPGKNLLDSMTTAQKLADRTLFGEGFAHDIADINDPEKSLLYRWAIADGWKLILSYDGEAFRNPELHPRNPAGPQLYDLSSDPHEANNLAKQYPEKVARLSAEIAQWYPLKTATLMTELSGLNK